MTLYDITKTKLYRYDIIVKSKTDIILDESKEPQDRDELMPFLLCEVLDIDILNDIVIITIESDIKIKPNGDIIVKAKPSMFTMIELDGIKHIKPFAAQKEEKKKEFSAQK